MQTFAKLPKRAPSSAADHIPQRARANSSRTSSTGILGNGSAVDRRRRESYESRVFGCRDTDGEGSSYRSPGRRVLRQR